jgi:hypothetical protein
MNEPAMIYCDDIERGELLPEGVDFDPARNYYETIPYVPGYRDDHPTIRGRTLSENSYSKLLPENKFLVGYNFKPLMAFLEAKITNENLVRIQNKRPFILSRSTALGYGKYGFHWLGDNQSNYKDMKNGVNGIFQFQIYGVPITGDDICGFGGDSWDNLCARWMTMGAFFPFSRNHNSYGQRPQEAYAFGTNSNTFKSSKLALTMRYSLLRYYYSELFKVSLGEKGSFFKPLFFNYFSDVNAYNKVSESFMLGDALLVYPVFKDETDDFEVSCFCPLKIKKDNKMQITNYFLAGGLDEEKRQGMIKLYKVKYNGREKNDKIKIEYLQEIIIKINKEFEGFNSNIECIMQCQKDGKILISSSDGNLNLFSEPNLDYYLEENQIFEDLIRQF